MITLESEFIQNKSRREIMDEIISCIKRGIWGREDVERTLKCDYLTENYKNIVLDAWQEYFMERTGMLDNW